MTWYLRKSVSLGPIRLNLSKSGIGTSVGVKGFRIGIRPDGRSYVHAGRYGLYYRQELGNIKTNNKTNLELDNKIIPSDTIYYDSLVSSKLTSISHEVVLEQLNKSYKSFRFDYLVGVLSLIVIFYCWKNSEIYGIISLVTGVLMTIGVIIWESKRRTININYEFVENSSNQFESVVQAFNNITKNKKIWSLLDSRYLYNTHESKLNSCAGSLVNRQSATAGKGTPPWVKINIPIPIIKTGSRSLYFMPDGVLIYDIKGVGIVSYEELIIEYGTTRFIESYPTGDSKIIGHAWKYANVAGGPDRRFKNNYQIPICLYGELKIKTDKGLIVYLMTSIDNSPEEFYMAMKQEISKNTNANCVFT